MKCLNCGADCTEGMKFCNECGASLDVVIPEKKDDAAEAAELERLQLMQQSAAEIPDDQQKKVISSMTTSEDTGITEQPANPQADNQSTPETQTEELVLQQQAPVSQQETPMQQQENREQQFNQSRRGPEFIQPQSEQGYIPPQAEPVNDFIPQPPPPEEDKPVKVGGLRITGASVITFFSVIILLGITLISSLKLGLTGERVEKQIKSMDTWAFVSSELDDRLVSDNLFGELHIGTATDYLYNEADFHSFLGESDILDFVGGKAGEYVNYIFSGKGKAPTVDADDITDFIKNNAERYDKDFAGAIDYRVIEDAMDKNGTLEYFDLGEIEDEIDFSTDTIRYGISYLTIGILAALLIVLMIWIAVIVDRKARFLLGFYGNIFKWSGILTFLAGLAIAGGTAVLHVVSNEAEIYLLSAVALPVGIYAMIIGFALGLLGFVFGKIKGGIKNKEKRSKAVEEALVAAEK